MNFVCSDMCQPYSDVAAKSVSQAIDVLVCYHVVAKMNQAIDEIGAAEAKRLKLDG